MSSLLDKTFTLSVRQVWRWTRFGLYAAVPIYLVLFFLKGWEIKMGGTSLQRSPFKERIPAECINRVSYQSNSHLPESKSTVADGVFLRDRVIESDVNFLIDGSDKTSECFVSLILTGLHGLPAGTGNIVRRWLDKQGQPVVSVHVRYHQTLEDIGFKANQETSK